MLEGKVGEQAEEIATLKAALIASQLQLQSTADSAKAQSDQVVEAIRRMVAAIPTAPTRATSDGGGTSDSSAIATVGTDGERNILISAPGGKVKVESSQCSIDDLCAVERLDSDGETANDAIAAIIDALSKLELE